MARKKQSAKAAFVLFNVTYEDGSQSSNRRVPSDLVGGLEGDDAARTVIEDQDNKIAAHSGQRRAKIKSIVRA